MLDMNLVVNDINEKLPSLYAKVILNWLEPKGSRNKSVKSISLQPQPSTHKSQRFAIGTAKGEIDFVIFVLSKGSETDLGYNQFKLIEDYFDVNDEIVLSDGVKISVDMDLTPSIYSYEEDGSVVQSATFKLSYKII